MALWGKTDADEAKPKWLTADQKANTFADSRGWVFTQPGGGEEILCAISELSAGLNSSDITEVRFVQAAYAAGSRTIAVDVSFNEKVTVTGTPRITVANGNQSSAGNGNYTLDYASGTGTNKLRFSKASQTVSATDVLTIGGAGSAAVALNGGTIKDTDASTLGSITIATATAGSTTFPTATVEADVDFLTVGTVNTLVAKVHSATVAAGGSNYAVGNEITIANGFGTGTNAVLVVATVNSGAVLTATVKPAAPGVYSAIAGGVTGIAQQSVNTGSGSGATFNLTLAVASLAVNAAGAGYEDAPTITLAGTGLTQSATAVMAGSAVSLVTTGATAQTRTVTS